MDIIKRPFWCILVLSFLTIIKTKAQPIPFDQHIVDSLSKKIPLMSEDIAKVKNLIWLTQMHISKGNGDLVLKYAHQADSISKKINYNIGRIEALGQMAFYHATTGDWPQSIMEINEAIPLTKSENTHWSVYLLNLKFISYGAKNDFKVARMWALRALNHPTFQIIDEMGRWPTYMQLGLSYEWENRLDSAEYYADILKELLKKYHHADLEGNTYSLLGNIARKKKNYDEALYYYRLGEQSTIGIAWVYDEQNKTDSAIYYAQKTLNLAQNRNDPRLILESSQILARLYAKIDPLQSNKYLQLYTATKDTLFNTDKMKQLEEIRLNEQKQRYEYIGQEKAFRSQMIQYTLLGLAVLFFISALFFYRNIQVKKSANEQLEKAYSQLNATHEALKSTQTQLIQSEKLASLGELTAGIAHEIQNPLNFVNNFSELSVELVTELKEEIQKTDLDKGLIQELADDLSKNQERINFHGKRASNIVKGMLEHSRASSGEMRLTDINTLVDEYLRLSYHGMRAKDKTFNADFNMKLDETIGKINIVPQDIGRVILNLFNNAFYAVHQRKITSNSEQYTPSVFVSTQRVDNEILIKVKDNGNGIPDAIMQKIFQPFFTTKPSGEGTGLGLSLSYDIVTKGHGGTLKVESPIEDKAFMEGGGTEFTIVLPL